MLNIKFKMLSRLVRPLVLTAARPLSVTAVKPQSDLAQKLKVIFILLISVNGLFFDNHYPGRRRRPGAHLLRPGHRPPNRHSPGF